MASSDFVARRGQTRLRGGGVALNQFINVAVAEKLSALRTEEYFCERAQRGNVRNAKRILKRAGRGNTPAPGDELN